MQRRYSLKDREEYKACKAKFLTKRNPGQATQAPATTEIRQTWQPKAQMEAGQMFYGDNSDMRKTQ